MNSHDMLRRLLRTQGTEPVEGPGQMTAGRAVRLATARAAEEALDLSLTVLGVTMEVEPLEPLVKRLAGDWMLLGLMRGEDMVGVAGLDLQTRAAAVEMQTLGQLRAAPAPERPMTPSDVALCAPLITSVLAELAEAAGETELGGWTDGVCVGVRLPDARAVGLTLPETRYRFVGVSLDLGVADRQGTLVVALPVAAKVDAPEVKDAETTEVFRARFQATVMEAPAILNAVLHHLSLPLSEVARFQVGDTLPLPGVTVASIRLEGPGGRVLGRARLGQVTGLRAVRLEVDEPAQLTDVHLPERPSMAAPTASLRPPGPMPTAMPMPMPMAMPMEMPMETEMPMATAMPMDFLQEDNPWDTPVEE